MSSQADEPQTDEALMLAYRGGDVSAFERLHARHLGWRYGLLVRQPQGSAGATRSLAPLLESIP